MSQRYNRSELRIYKAAVRSKKGVVGSNGRNIPITPNINEMLPNMINKYFTIVFLLSFYKK